MEKLINDLKRNVKSLKKVTTVLDNKKSKK
jgi:hypothetical protein